MPACLQINGDILHNNYTLYLYDNIICQSDLLEVFMQLDTWFFAKGFPEFVKHARPPAYIIIFKYNKF